MLSTLKCFIFITHNIPEKLGFCTWLVPTEQSDWPALTDELCNAITRPRFKLKTLLDMNHSLCQVQYIKIKLSHNTPMVA
jgi:hypothetical protein